MAETLEQLESRILHGSDRPIQPRDFVRLIRVTRRLVGSIESGVNMAEDRTNNVRSLLDQHKQAYQEKLAMVDGRLDAIEQNALRLTVVANVGQLPASAGFRQWFRVSGSQDVYVGNGAGQPLTRLVPQQIP